MPVDGACVLGSAEVGDADSDDPQVYESMCNIHTGSCEVASNCAAADGPAPTAPVPQDDQDENAHEDIYEYDSPRAAAPPPPTRRTLSDISGPAAAFGALSIESLETSMSQHLHTSGFSLSPNSVSSYSDRERSLTQEEHQAIR